MTRYGQVLRRSCGLTGLRAPPPATVHGRMDPAHAMNYDVTRAQQLGISVDVFAGAGSFGSARSLHNSVRVGYPPYRAIDNVTGGIIVAP
jgi:hypothetical protein